MKKRIVVAITGASGAIYAKVLLDKLSQLQDQIDDIGVLMSQNAEDVWKYELRNEDYQNYPFTRYAKDDFTAPFASGSAKFKYMVICPCSMGTMSRIATGISNDLVTRAADVILKERRKLVLVARDTPYNLIHLRNMQTITEAGGIICPASPSFYSRPATFEDLASTVVDRILDLFDFDIQTFRWSEENVS
ncbi:MAG: UbiX family flavin prenyltransferase [Flavobacteriales bacterium]|nr:UbiX family flavin prenyltransferase [Flavobacteriales bacterium]